MQLYLRCIRQTAGLVLLQCSTSKWCCSISIAPLQLEYLSLAKRELLLSLTWGYDKLSGTRTHRVYTVMSGLPDEQSAQADMGIITLAAHP